MHDYPATAKFLSEDDRREVQRRLEADRSYLDDTFNLKYLQNAISDWKIWVHMLITFGIYTPLYSVSLFLPTIIKGLGYENEKAQLMTVPPYVVACAFCITAGWLADKHGQRGIYMIACNLLAYVHHSLTLTFVPHQPRRSPVQGHPSHVSHLTATSPLLLLTYSFPHTSHTVPRPYVSQPVILHSNSHTCCIQLTNPM